MSLTKVNRSENLLYPPFRHILELGLEKARSSGLKVYLFEGLRFPQRQLWLYEQGRTRPGNIVTNARPGQSWHHYGLAADLVFDGNPTPGIQWAWDGDYIGKKGKDYDILGPIMMSMGLEWLGLRSWDKPHFQLTRGLNIYQASLIAQKNGILGVWHEMDKIFGKEA